MISESGAVILKTPNLNYSLLGLIYQTARDCNVLIDNIRLNLSLISLLALVRKNTLKSLKEKFHLKRSYKLEPLSLSI